MTAYTFKFNTAPTQANFDAIAGEVVWDTVFAHSPKAAYTRSSTVDSTTLVFERGELSPGAQVELLNKLQDLAVEFA